MPNKEKCLYLDKNIELVGAYTPLYNSTIGTIVYEMHVTFIVVILFLLFFTTVPLVLVGIIIVMSLIIASNLFFGTCPIYRIEKILGGKNIANNLVIPMISLFGLDNTKMCRRNLTFVTFIIVLLVAVIRLLYLVNKRSPIVIRHDAKKMT